MLETGNATAEGAGFKVTLASYGPGVVFAMFGAFIVIFSLTRGMSLHTKQTYTEDGRLIEEASAADAAAAGPYTIEATAEADSAPLESSPEGEAPMTEPASPTQ